MKLIDFKGDIYIGSSYRIDLDSYIIRNEIIHPIRCGACFDKLNKNDLLGDNTGENISQMRNSYCELTVQYWMWKNVQAEYYGLCHYRRMLSFSDIEYKENKRNQIIEEFLNEETCKKYCIDSPDKMRSMITPYDIVTAKPYDVRKKKAPNGYRDTVRDFWKAHDQELIYEKDIDILENMIYKYAPEYYEDAKEYLDGYMFLGYNCFIIKKELFNELCQFEFKVMDEFEKNVDMSEYKDAMIRTPGFLCEILYSIFVYHKKKQGKYKISERQLVFFKDTETAFVKDKIVKEKRKAIVLVIDSLNPYEWNQCIQSILSSLDEKQLYYLYICYRFLPDSLMEEWKKLLEANEVVYYKFQNLNLIDLGKEKQYLRHLNMEIYLPWYIDYLEVAYVIRKSCIFSNKIFMENDHTDAVCVNYGKENQIRYLHLEKIRKLMDIDVLFEKIANNKTTWDDLLNQNQIQFQRLNDCELLEESHKYAKEFYKLNLRERMNLRYPKGSSLRNKVMKFFVCDSLLGRIMKYSK